MTGRSVEQHGRGHHHESMLSVEEALAQILGLVRVLDAEDRPVLDALGQVLAEDVAGPFDIPALDNSAMDGYAVQTGSVVGASRQSPVVLRVIGAVAAGQLPREEVTPGTAVRIMTGAPVPHGADAIVPFEETDEADRKANETSLDEIGVLFEVARGDSVRPAGQDVRSGEVVLEKGTVLRPSEVGLLASMGYGYVRVIRRPVVSVLATGDELVELGGSCGPGKIYDSNTYSVAASVVRCGGIPRILGIARDNRNSVSSKLREALGSDILITSAGVSKGDYDLVKDVLARHGKIEFWAVRMRPAKPLAFGMLSAPSGKQVPHLGLPGNPVSALVGFEQFGRPAILKMLGNTSFKRPTIQAILEEPIYNTDGRRVFARVVVAKREGEYYARLTGNQSSNLFTSMTRANGLAICPEDLPKKDAGEKVTVEMLDWPQDVLV